MPVSKKRRRTKINFAKIAESSKPQDATRIKFEEHAEDARGAFQQVFELEDAARRNFSKMIKDFFIPAGIMKDGEEVIDEHFKFCYQELSYGEFDPFLFISALRVVRKIHYSEEYGLKARIDSLHEKYDYHTEAADELINHDAPQSPFDFMKELQDFYGYSDPLAMDFLSTISYFSDYDRSPGIKGIARQYRARNIAEDNKISCLVLMGLVDAHGGFLDHYLKMTHPKEAE